MVPRNSTVVGGGILKRSLIRHCYVTVYYAIPGIHFNYYTSLPAGLTEFHENPYATVYHYIPT